jgi:drug/metabolite transporter (DMT)-like permease
VLAGANLYRMRRERLFGLGILVLTTIIWGSTFPLVKGALAEVPPLQFVAWRFALAAVCLLPWLLRGQGLKAALPGLTIGLANAGGFLLQTFALKTVGADQVAFLTGLSVILVPIADAIGRRTWPTRAVLAALAAGLVGLALMTMGRHLTWSVGDLLGLLCAGLFTVQVLGTSRLARRVGSMRLAAQEVASGAIAFGLAALVWHPAWLLPPPSAVWPLAAFLALFATVGTLTLQSAGQARVGATTAAITFNLEPVFATGWAFVLRGESLTLREGLGALFVLASMVVAALAPGEAVAATGAQGALVPAAAGEDLG